MPLPRRSPYPFIGLALVLTTLTGTVNADQLVYVPLGQPCRLLDTRASAGGTPLIAGTAYLFGTSTADIASAVQHGNASGCGISAQATAATVNMNMLNATAPGNIATWDPDTGTTAPNIGTGVYNPSVAAPIAGQVEFNTGYSTIPLASPGGSNAGRFYLKVANGQIDMTINVVGYWLPVSWSENRNGNRAVALGAGTHATGDYSTALGTNTYASQSFTTALGEGTVANSPYATAMGYATTAKGVASFAVGGPVPASGGSPAINTAAVGDYSIAMGQGVSASGNNSTAMGYVTTASGLYSTVTGLATTASNYGSTAIGDGTTASGKDSTAMGYVTTASGSYSTAMGSQTTASGDHSTAMGTYASTNGKNGSFVYGDSSVTSSSIAAASVDNQFVVVATGGVRFWTSLNTGASLASGSGSWTTLSDRNAKDAVAPVDTRAVLAKVVAMPLNTWQYKAQEAKYRHMGPMAQDFYAAFRLGESDTGIDTVDADGVALAAIQGLYAQLQDKQDEIAALRAELADQKSRIAALESSSADIAEIKRHIATLGVATRVATAEQP